jgi:hypothetical protein
MLHVAVTEMNQNGTAMRAIKGILALCQIRQQDTCLRLIQMMVGFDGSFTAHHDRRRFTEFLDAD